MAYGAKRSMSKKGKPSMQRRTKPKSGKKMAKAYQKRM